MSFEEKPREGTVIDLGEDLLHEKTLSSTQISKDQAELEPSEEDRFENAKIFFQEGFFEDAKKILRKLIRSQPYFLAAQCLLDTILEKELNAILSSSEIYKKKEKESASISELTSSFILEQLDHDLDLGILKEPEWALEAFVRELEIELLKNERVEPFDFGLGFIDCALIFIQMELWIEAEYFLQNALKRIKSFLPDLQDLFVVSSCLLAQVYLNSQKPYDALECLRPLIKNPELSSFQKCESLYLMGLLYTELKEFKTARFFFEQVESFDPYYRNLKDYLKKNIS